MNNNSVSARGLLANYGKMAWRSLIKNKFTGIVSITGLVIGLTGSFFIGLFVLDELAYDKHFENNSRIYRVTSTYKREGHLYSSAQTRGDISDQLLHKIPEIQAAARLMPSDEGFIFTDKGAFKEKIIYTDSLFLTVFGLDLLKGNKSKCLARPSSLIVSERTAVKLFGNDWAQKEVLGKTLSLDGWLPLSITGVFKNFPRHTHFQSDLFASVPSGLGWMDEHSEVYTYVLLHPQTDKNNITRKFRDLSVHPVRDENTALELQPLSDIYLYSSLQDENALQGNVKNIYALLLISFFLIVITVVNFVNLYTAGSFSRLKEVGVRKTMGALQGQLRLQFFGETGLITLLSMGIAFSITVLLLPTFNQLTGKQLSTSSLFNDEVSMLIGSVTLAMALMAGCYPALYLSGRKTIDALKGLKSSGIGAVEFRKGLIILQFSLSCMMIILSIVAFQQVGVIANKDLGFDRANTLAISNPYMLGSVEKIQAFRKELLKVSGVEEISITGYTPSQTRWGREMITFPDRNQLSNQRQHATWTIVDESFISTMGIQLLEGRNFLENHKHDKAAIIINQTAAAHFKLNANGKSPLGSELSYHEAGRETPEHFKVIGVVADFNFGSLHEKIKPVIMKPGYHRFEMAMRISPQYAAGEILRDIESVWTKSLPLIPFQYSYIQSRFDNLHRSDVTASKLFSIFCILTVLMSAVGLFSMVTYSVASRTKEFGIRKLLGASGPNITFLVAKDFLRLVIIAYVLSLPFAWLIAERWVNNFAYKTEITWWVFALTGVILLVVCFLTLSYQALRACRTNPVENLRHE